MSDQPRSVLPVLLPAVTSVLLAHAGLTAKVSTRIHTFIPEDAPTPFVAVMGGQEAPANTLGHHGRLAEVLISVDSTYRGTTEVDAVISEVIHALDGQRLALSAPWTGARLEWVRSNRPVIVDGADVSWERTAEFLARCA